MVKSEITTPLDTTNDTSLSTITRYVTPASVTSVVLVIALLAVFIVNRQQTNTVTTVPSKQAADSSLQVRRSDGSAQQSSTNATDLQSTSGGQAAGDTNGTTPLNSTGSTPDTAQSATYNQPNLNGTTLNN